MNGRIEYGSEIIRGAYPSPFGRGQGEGTFAVLAAEILIIVVFMVGK
jgi:hypothetical protein